MTRIDRLRRACAWYEWSERDAVADVLQAAADAAQAGDLSDAAVDLMLALWRPFLALETRVDQPVEYVVADTAAEVEAGIVADLRACFARTTNTARRAHLIELMDLQIRNFVEGTRHDRPNSIDT